MRVKLRCRLDAPAETVWAHALTSRLLEHVAAPLVRFQPLAPPALPARWQDGRYRVRIHLFGILPVGRQWIVISRPRLQDHRAGIYRIRDEGAGDLVKVWDHRITIAARDDGATDYRDDVEVEAGLLTPFVWLFAQVFYRHRQARWRRLASRGFSFD